jgi:competence protein ComEA
MAMLHKMITLRQLSLYWIQISILCLFSSILHAQQFDQSYHSWKTQQAHDQRLKASSSTADYYLGKPSLQNTSATFKTIII